MRKFIITKAERFEQQNKYLKSYWIMIQHMKWIYMSAYSQVSVENKNSELIRYYKQKYNYDNSHHL